MICQISSGYFIALLKLEKDIAISAEPALTFMLKWTLDEVKKYCKEKKWEVICV